MKMMRNMCLRKAFTFVVVCFAVALLSMSCLSVGADEVPAFFLKIAKNIPRVGRSDRFEDYFLKAAKNIPRIGKRSDYQEFEDSMKRMQRMDRDSTRPSAGDFFKKLNAPSAGNRDTYESSNQRMPVINENEGRSGPTKRMLSVPSVGMDDPTWSHFPLAIEGPPELWRTLAAYTNERMGYGSDDIDNEIWHRDKRTGNRQESEA